MSSLKSEHESVKKLVDILFEIEQEAWEHAGHREGNYHDGYWFGIWSTALKVKRLMGLEEKV